MERYIEVIGEGESVEIASCFIAAIVLEVRAAKDETAFAELSEFFHDAITILRSAGITDEELTEGGADFHRPWWRRKQVGQTATRRIVLKVKEFGRLNAAIEKLEPLQARSKDRKTMHVDMRQPEFNATDESKANVLALAYGHARVKAEKLATTMNGKLGKVIHAEEGSWSKRNSGFSGDEDWGGDSSRFAMAGGILMAAGANAAELELDLQKPSRTIFVKCRIRFELLDADN